MNKQILKNSIAESVTENASLSVSSAVTHSAASPATLSAPRGPKITKNDLEQMACRKETME